MKNYSDISSRILTFCDIFFRLNQKIWMKITNNITVNMNTKGTDNRVNSALSVRERSGANADNALKHIIPAVVRIPIQST